MLRRFAFMLSLSLSITLSAQSVRPTPRIKSAPDSQHLAPLARQVHSLARPEFDQGAVDPSLPLQRILLLLKPSDDQQKALDQFLMDVQDKSSPQYHHWLSPDEFGRRFGVADQDIQTIQSWLTAQGFTLGPVAHNHLMLEFSGTAAQVSSAFQTEIHNYNVKGEMHIANANNPSIPSAFAPVITGFLSLHDFRQKPTLHSVQFAGSGSSSTHDRPFINSSTGVHAVAPDDFATIYDIRPLYQAGIDGTGETIAVPTRANFDRDDVVNFRGSFGLPYINPTVIFNGPIPTTSNQLDEDEVELDLEWSGAIARNAALTAVVSVNTATSDGIDLSNVYIIDNFVAPILSVSYGPCETQYPSIVATYTQLWRQAAAQGMSVLVSSGDSGSALCDDPDATLARNGLAVSAIASQPDVVAVGGTQFNDVANPAQYWSPTNGVNGVQDSALSYIPEVVWNEAGSKGIWAGSGGVSTVFPTPSWQTGTGVPTSDPGTPGAHHRYLPDLSLTAAGHDGYITCLRGHCFYLVSGTSASVQAFAGIIALVDQKMGDRQGNPNFHIYPLSNVSGVYHDVTSGTNAVPCFTGTPNCANGTLSGYSAGPGFDLATGWGSVDANQFVTNWPNVAFRPTTVNASASPNPVQHGAFATVSATVTAASGTPTGSLQAYAVSGNQTLQLGTPALSSGTASTSTNQLPGGTTNVYFRYFGDGTYGTATSAGIPLTITPEPTTLNVIPPSGSVPLNSTYTFNYHAAGQSGVGVPTGTITMTQNQTPLGTATLDGSGNASFIPYYYPAGPGTYTFSFSYSGDQNFAPASSSVDVTFTRANLAATFACAQTGTLVVGTPVNCTLAIVYPAIGVVPAPTGSVQFYLDGQAYGSPIALSATGVTVNFTPLSVGQHTFSMQYPGDSYYLPYSLTTTPLTVLAMGNVNISFYDFVTIDVPGDSFAVYISYYPLEIGPAITGTFTLYDGSTQLTSIPVPNCSFEGPCGTSVLVNTSTQPLSLGAHSLTLTYSGDSAWDPATFSSPSSIQITEPQILLYGIAPMYVSRGQTTTQLISTKQIGIASGSMVIACSGAPAETSCNVNPSSVQINPDGTGPTITLTVLATAPHSVRGHQSASRRWLPFAFMPVAVVFCAASVPRRRKYSVSLLAILLVCLSLVSSCGGGGGGNAFTGNNGSSSSGSTGSGGTTPTPPSTPSDPGTPTGNYTLTLTTTYRTGTDAITNTYPVQVTVQ